MNSFAPENAYFFTCTIFILRSFNNYIRVFQVLEFLQGFFQMENLKVKK